MTSTLSLPAIDVQLVDHQSENAAGERHPVEVFGIRHHGPGSARSLVAALTDYQPDAVLIEGPADADPVLRWVLADGMAPPLALLGYAPDHPQTAAARADLATIMLDSIQIVPRTEGQRTAANWAAATGISLTDFSPLLNGVREPSLDSVALTRRPCRTGTDLITNLLFSLTL